MNGKWQGIKIKYQSGKLMKINYDSTLYDIFVLFNSAE